MTSVPRFESHFMNSVPHVSYSGCARLVRGICRSVADKLNRCIVCGLEMVGDMTQFKSKFHGFF